MAEEWRTLRVPASSANLGPGFDTLALAVEVFLECRFRRAARLAIRVSGCDAGLISTEDDNLIWQIASTVCGCDAMELEIVNHIPLGKGLGSSAAAVTAGIVIGATLMRLEWDRSRVLNEAALIEGHPDNVAACVLGGLVASATDAWGVSHAVRLELHPKYRAAIVVPDFLLPTTESRQVLPDAYSRHDAIFNIQRAALLVAALASGASEAFPTALEDRLHQPYRLALVPGLKEILELRAPGLLGCALSGAGPSVLVFYERGREEVCELVRREFTARGRASQVMWTDVAPDGYRLD
jgi:homoserine kinase